MPPNQVEALARGQACQSWPGQQDEAFILRLAAKERREFDRARERGFLAYRDLQDRLANAWWRWCRETGKPHVAVKARRRYAWVMLDMPPGVELSPRALEAACVAVTRHTPHGGWGYAPHAVGHPKVPINEAEVLAEELLCIARQELHRRG